MRTLTPISCDHRDLFLKCVADYSYAPTQDQKDRLTRSVDAVVALGLQYEQSGQSARLQDIEPHEKCGVALKKDLVNLYDAKFVPEGKPGRDTYLQIRQLAPRGICPLCDHRVVSTLDHCLPKAKFPGLAVFPLNLVPACSSCNETKRTEFQGLTIHPYFDDVTQHRWLQCELDQADPLAVVYSAMPGVYDSSVTERLENHLKFLGIGALYAAQAVEHLADEKAIFIELFASGGSNAVKQHITQGLRSRELRRINSWSTALYHCLESSHWFIDGGFHSIGD